MSPQRKRVSLTVKLQVALRQLGLDPKTAQLDHDPALQLRPIVADEWVPHQHDPAHLVWRSHEDHHMKTTGRQGTSKLSISGNGDVSRIAKVKRLRAVTPAVLLSEQGVAALITEDEILHRALVRSTQKIGELKQNPKFPKAKPSWPQGRKIANRPFQKKE